jgi:uncharacterized glyoxalase superfamily protein PhnB
VKSNRSLPAATVIPVLIYPDVREAVEWLTAAFGFRERIKIGDDHRSQMSIGEGGAVIIGDARRDRVPPQPGVVTHQLKVATILSEPTDQPYGEREYDVADPWDHRWQFSETVDEVDPASWGGEVVEP